MKTKIEEIRPGRWRLYVDPLDTAYWTPVVQVDADDADRARYELMSLMRNAIKRAEVVDYETRAYRETLAAITKLASDD